MRTGRGFASLVVVLLAVLASACGDDNPAASASPSPTDNPTSTDTFSGTLSVRSATWHTFTAVGSGTMTLTLTSIAPTVTVGMGVGNTPTGGCSVQAWNNVSTTGTVISAGINPGLYCVSIYDVGNVTENVGYTLTVVHP